MTHTELRPQRYVLWGSTGQAKVLRECLGSTGMSLLAVFDRNPDVTPVFSDVPMPGGKQDFERWIQTQDRSEPIGFLAAIGGDHGRDRLDVHDYLQSFGLCPITAVHPTAFVARHANLGEGCQILANASVCEDVVLGRQCIVNTSAGVDHDSRLDDGVHICPGAHLAGEVRVGECTMIGTGASVCPRVRIGRNSVIGAGAVVISDIPDGVVAVGNPARVIRKIPNPKH